MYIFLVRMSLLFLILDMIGIVDKKKSTHTKKKKNMQSKPKL